MRAFFRLLFKFIYVTRKQGQHLPHAQSIYDPRRKHDIFIRRKGILIYADESVIRKLNKHESYPDANLNLRIFSDGN